MGKFGPIVRDLRRLLKKVSHEVPTGPHTDVRRREINPSFLKNRRSGSDPKRPQKQLGQRAPGQRATHGYGKAYMKGGKVK